MSHKQELQNAHSTKFLNYGHLGTLTYDEEEERWETSRIVEPHHATAQHSDSGQHCRTAFPLRHLSSKVSWEGSSTPQHQSRSTANNNDVDGADGSHLGPGMSSHIHCRAEDKPGSYKGFESDDFSAAEKHSPNCSTLLAFGSAVSARTTGSSSVLLHVPIAASVSSSNAEAIRLVRMGKETIENLDCDPENGALQVAYISNGDQAYWISTGGPIQQVCFAAADGYPSTWMAARLQCSTTIFHPIIHSRPVSSSCGTSHPSSQPLPPSVLEPNPIITIPNSRTGGHPHADISFNPHEHLKFALIDEHGNWSVWLVDGEHQDSPRSRFWVTLICSGKLWTWEYEKRLRASLPYHDGWHRISWCVHPESNEIFICNRRTAAVYKSTGTLIGLRDLRLGHARENQVILDVRWSAFVPGHCFVLTSTRLFWLYFMDTQSRQSVSGHNAPHVLLTWQHFRGRGDGTLHLVLLETGLTTIVLVFSRLIDLVLAFRLGLVNGNRGLPVSLADPLPIFLPQHPTKYVSRSPPSSSVFRAIECHREAEGADGSEKPFLFKLFSLYDDLSIVEHLYSSTEPGFGLIAEAAFSSVLQLPSGTAQPELGPKRPDRATSGSFVVPDDDVEWTACLTEKQYDRYSRNSKRTPRSRTPPNLDWQDVYNHIIKKDDGSGLIARIDMAAFVSRLSDHLNQARPPKMALLSELMSFRLHIGDIDDDSDKFEHFTSAINSQPDRVKMLEQVRCESSLPSGLSSAYDAIVAVHLTPLSPQVPDRVRVNRERLARRVSADLLLASTAICPRFTIPTDILDGDTLSQRATSQPTPHDSFPEKSAPRPVSDPTTMTKTPTTATAEEDPLLIRLRNYTTISPTSSSTISTPILTSILRHLPTSPFTDPKTYNYRATERSLAAEYEEEIAIAAGVADPKARRRAEKARARREEAKRRAVEEAVSRKRAPPMLLSSQVQVGGFGHGMREVQSSQVRGTVWDGDPGPSQGQASRQGQGAGSSQEMQMQTPMTQPERGVFGTRLGVGTAQKRDKGKKRAAGF